MNIPTLRRTPIATRAQSVAAAAAITLSMLFGIDTLAVADVTPVALAAAAVVRV